MTHYETDLLQDIVICLWDFLQKCNKITPTPLSVVRRIEDRMQDEICQNLSPCIMIATMDGLTPIEISTLTAPLTKTICNELASLSN